jgi:hypothetical protein
MFWGRAGKFTYSSSTGKYTYAYYGECSQVWSLSIASCRFLID